MFQASTGLSTAGWTDAVRVANIFESSEQAMPLP
jgi:hypothetical protein